MSIRATVILATAVALLSACGSNRPIPAMNLADARIEAAVTQANLVLDGTRSSVGGNAAKAGGTGLLVSAIACGMTGFLAVVCFSTVLPPVTLASGLAGAATTAARQDAPAELQAKTAVLQPLVAGRPLPEYLAVQLRERSGPAPLSQRKWLLKVSAFEIGTLGTGAGEPFGLTAAAQIDVVAADSASPPYTQRFEFRGAERLQLSQWAADDGAAARAAMEKVVAGLAASIACRIAGDADAQPAPHQTRVVSPDAAPKCP